MYTPEPPEESQQQLAPDQPNLERTIPAKSQHLTSSTPQHAPLDTESIQRGLIYPPPPAYYEREKHAIEAAPVDTPSIAPKEQTTQSPPPSPSLTPYPPTSQQRFAQSYYPTTSHPPTPGYPPGVQPPFVTVPPRQKKSRKWLWISTSIVAVVVVLSCGLCSWIAYPIATQAYQQASSAVYGSQELVNDYYSDIQNQQYGQAYTYLTPQGSSAHLSQTQFIQEAQQRDKQYGPVYSFTAGAPSVGYNNTSGQTINSFTITITVARARSKYTVNLSAQKVNGVWKIEAFNQI